MSKEEARDGGETVSGTEEVALKEVCPPALDPAFLSPDFRLPCSCHSLAKRRMARGQAGRQQPQDTYVLGRRRTQKSLLLLLLSLVAIAKAAIVFPQNPGCPHTDDKNFLQNVKLNLNILSPSGNSRRPSNYYNRSTSPWNLHRNEDPERYPPVIWEAKCRHLGCINAEGKVDHHMNSVPIQQEILVLRREPQHCPNSFRLEKMVVAVGCTCVTPIIRHVA
ncbi:interleukin-17A [Callospermophilus lateralis]